MEFKINDVTNNPVPTDIFAFKKLANKNARGNSAIKSRRTAYRNNIIVGEATTPSNGRQSRRQKSAGKYKRNNIMPARTN